MSIWLIVAVGATALLVLLLWRNRRTRVVLLVVAGVAVVAWLVVLLSRLSDTLSQPASIQLPDLKFLLFAVSVSVALLAGSFLALGAQSFRTVSILLGAIWIAGSVGWVVGEWSGVLAITMPSLLTLIVGLLALPPFLLPVPPLPWKWPTLFAMLYFFGWLVGLWTHNITMDIIAFWVFLQGLLLILRFAYPLPSAAGFVPLMFFILYGLTTFVLWRVMRLFALTPLNLVVLVQGLLVLSAYALPVTGQITDRFFGLPLLSSTLLWAIGLGLLYGVFYISAMTAGRIQPSLTNFWLLFLGMAAIFRFIVPSGRAGASRDQGSRALDWIVALGLLVLYLTTWISGVMTDSLALGWFEWATFFTGAFAIFAPLLVEPSENWEAFKAILTYNMGRNYPYKVQVGRRLVTRAEGVLPFTEIFAGPGIILTNADHALVVYKGGNFDFVAPPGLTFTRTFQMDREAVDLRIQLRVTEVQATTRDGIPITVPVFTPMRVATGGQRITQNAPYPFLPEAVRQVVHTAHVFQKGKERQRWDMLVRQAVERIMRDIIAARRADDLRGLEPRQEIVTELRQQLEAFLEQEDMGLELVGCGIGNLMPPPDVIQQRVKHWQAHWKREIQTELTEADANERLRAEHAWAEAQRDWLREIVEGMKEATGMEERDRTTLMALTLLHALERAGTEYPELAGPARRASKTLQAQIGFSGLPDEGKRESP